MAAYVKTPALLKNLEREIESSCNTVYKIIYNELFKIVNDEFAKMQSDTLGSYTVTAGITQTVTDELINMGDTTRMIILQDFMEVFIAECQLVQANGLAYTVSSNLSKNLEEQILNFAGSEDRINLTFAKNIMVSEFGLVEAAS